MFILAAREIGPPSKLTLRKERSLRSHTPMTCVRLKDNLYPYLIPEMTLKDNNIQKSIERLDCLSSSNIISTISTKVFYFSSQTLLPVNFFLVCMCVCVSVYERAYVCACACVCACEGGPNIDRTCNAHNTEHRRTHCSQKRTRLSPETPSSRNEVVRTEPAPMATTALLVSPAAVPLVL